MDKTVEIPDGVEVKLEGRTLTVRGPRGELSRDIRGSPVSIDVKDGAATVSSESDRRKVKSHAGTWAAHIRNMIAGVTRGHEARLKVVYSHFPMKLTAEGQAVRIGNFLGERRDRTAKVKGEVRVEVKKDEVIVTGNDKEEVGQAAAVIEQATKVRGFDKRVFQDGVHLTRKASPMEMEAEKHDQ